ncbi:MAG: alpha/beta hydrolase [Anaerolineae bacterium]|nr:alpha/beta hydrolase [Anaerolineae bacterium]
MMDIPTLDGVRTQMIETNRIKTRVLFTGPDDGIPVLFLHGNLSSATWWEETMLALPQGFRGIAPDQRAFGLADADKKIDATRGAGDWADDALALLDKLSIQKVHLVGNSLGGNAVWYMMAHYPERLLTVTQIAPGSPYGFGGTKDVDGTPCYPDFAGSGGGLTNPKVVEAIQAGDRSTENPFSLTSAFRALVWKPPFVPSREEDIVTSSLLLHIGPEDTPGDMVPTANWPYVSPGKWGPNNALSPKYVGDTVEKLIGAEPKPPVLWVRGSHDLAVSDTAAGDIGSLGPSGIIPNYPGPEVYPPQPMLAQTRHVLDQYQAKGGHYREEVMDGCAHAPFLEKPEVFNALFHAHLQQPE